MTPATPSAPTAEADTRVPTPRPSARAGGMSGRLGMSPQSFLLQWGSLIAAAAVLSLLLGLAGFPAALLLGPMLAAVVFGVRGATITVSRTLFIYAQGVAGCLIGHGLSASILGTIVADWPTLLFAISLTVFSATTVGVLVGRWGGVPRDAAIWGFLPGMASAMIALAHEQKVDSRLVAFMQYVRLVTVILGMSLVGWLALPPGAAPRPLAIAQDAGWLPLAETLLIAALAFVGAWLRFLPAGSALLPMIAAAALQVSGTVSLSLPPWLLDLAYGVIGFQVGLRFTRETVRYVTRLIPMVILGSIGLVVMCGASAWTLTAVLGIDPLTAFLATVPGSIDSVAIIAIGSHADISFVMALQTVRLFVVILVGPPLARLACRLVR